MKILIPLDGSDLALAAVHHALRLIQRGLRASFVIANVEEPAGVVGLLMMPDARAREEINQHVGNEALTSGAALLEAAGATFEREVRTGYAKSVLIDIAECYGCEAIIMGARGTGMIRGALLGSVSQGVLHSCKLPVTIVHQTAAAT
jgi:nucleotide-binding universal stress UspA family protein